MRFLINIVFLLVLAPALLAGTEGQPLRVEVTNVWSRPTGGRTMSGVIYMTLINRQQVADKLLSVMTPAADISEIHTSITKDSATSMQQLDSLSLPAGATVKLGSGGHHIMMMRLSVPLSEGYIFPVTLTFQHAGSVTVLSRVQKRAARHQVK